MCSARKRSVLSAQPVKVYVKPSLYVPEERSVIQGSPSRSHIMKHARATSRNDGPGEQEKNSSRAKKKICSVVVQSVPGYLMAHKVRTYCICQRPCRFVDGISSPHDAESRFFRRKPCFRVRCHRVLNIPERRYYLSTILDTTIGLRSYLIGVITSSNLYEQSVKASAKYTYNDGHSPRTDDTYATA